MTHDVDVSSAQHDMSYGFIQLQRSNKVDELMGRAPMAFLLLTQIALRARRDAGGLNPHKLIPGQALIGDHKSIGLTQQQYRTAKSQLQKWEIATFKATTLGTLATLCDSSIYNINIEGANEPSNKPSTNGQQAGNERVTTKKNGKKENNEKEGKEPVSSKGERPTREELTAHVTGEMGMTKNDADHVWNVWEENGWTRSQAGKRIPISSWKGALATWKTGHYFPSQKAGGNVTAPAPKPAPSKRDGLSTTDFRRWLATAYPKAPTDLCPISAPLELVQEYRATLKAAA